MTRWEPKLEGKLPRQPKNVHTHRIMYKVLAKHMKMIAIVVLLLVMASR